MPMSMMQVRIVRVFVPHGLVLVPVRVWLAGWIIRTVRMLVMVIVRMAMLVFHRHMLMLVFVGLNQMEVEADRHQHTRDHEPGG